MKFGNRKTKKGMVIEYALFMGAILFSFSMIIFNCWTRSQLRDRYFDSHISQPIQFEKAGQEFFRTVKQYSSLSPETLEENDPILNFKYSFSTYKYNSEVTKQNDIYTYKVNICTDEENDTWELTLKVRVSITTEKIVEWYFVNPLLESESYNKIVKGGDE